MSPTPFFSRYIIDWLATQTMTRAQQMVVDEVKSRVESGDLGSYEGVLFKNSIKGNAPKDRITASGVELGVVVATKQEVVGLLDKMGTPKVTKGDSFKYYLGAWKGRSIAIVETGAGLAAARRGAEALIQSFHPARVASIGFASSVVPSLGFKTLFMPEFLVSETGETLDLRQRALTAEVPSKEAPTVESASDSQTSEGSAPVSVEPSPEARGESEKAPDVESEAAETANRSPINLVAELTSRFRTGTLLSLDSSKPTAEQRKSVSAYDHSTWAVADVCANLGIPFLPLRVVYDYASQKTRSPEAARVVKNNQSFARTMGAFFGATMKKPSAALDVFKFKEEELEAADKLASAVCGILATIVAPEKR